MATAQPIVSEEPNYQLTISTAEARVLASVLSRLAGSSYCSPRKHSDSILNALGKAGLHYEDKYEDTLLFGEIHYEEYQN